MALTESQVVILFMYVFITVPTTCSRPSIEMVGFIYLLLCRLLVVGPVLKWLALLLLCFLRVHSPGHTVIYF